MPELKMLIFLSPFSLTYHQIHVLGKVFLPQSDEGVLLAEEVCVLGDDDQRKFEETQRNVPKLFNEVQRRNAPKAIMAKCI